MRAWGVGSGELERMPYARRARLAERLRAGRLARWAELMGRFRQMADGERARKVESATGELVGVTLGDDLSRLIPSELANLGLPGLRSVFAARYAAGELMLYDSRGEQPTGRGAVIACVDTSHSMYAAGPGGVTREAWSKACALALLDQARHAGRDFVGILFSAEDRIQVFRFPAGRSAGIEQVLDFAETFLGGGTSYQAPLTVARELLEEEFGDATSTRGDIVMITDDECGVTKEWTRGWTTPGGCWASASSASPSAPRARPRRARSWTPCATTSAPSRTSPTSTPPPTCSASSDPGRTVRVPHCRYPFRKRPMRLIAASRSSAYGRVRMRKWSGRGQLKPVPCTTWIFSRSSRSSTNFSSSTMG